MEKFRGRHAAVAPTSDDARDVVIAEGPIEPMVGK